MATASPTKSELDTRSSVAKPSQEVAQGQGLLVGIPSRREFLYYIWGASIALMLGEVGAGLLWFAFPRFKEGEFGGEFPITPADIPAIGDAPIFVASGRFHVSNTENGLLALYGVCTHLGCLPKWVATNTRFECPCHGSKFTGKGSWIEGPAPRGLDRFITKVIYSDGTEVETDGTGGPVPLVAGKAIATIRVNTGKKVSGPSH